MILYLVLGALFVPLLHGHFDFLNGIYFAFICLTAIEYGDLVPDNNWYVPIVIVYVCIGLAISTIALGMFFFAIALNFYPTV
ncbi:Ion channel [Oesophagostomum dentatum]|uniref:Ion channel n=1 Tax=Oesophagostomum dentatum TaxID=61180 RepID=A0A0B1T6W3_OESDE|nr:Ion channel [Oesophagostomum dentatum]